MATQLAPALDTVRLSLHVLAAAVWVGGQLTLAGLLPAVRALGPDAPRRVARAFGRLSWPAFAVLVATGAWNVLEAGRDQPTAWRAVLYVKMGVVALAGVAAWLHGRSRARTGLAVWGATAGTASLAALVLGMLLAG